MPSVVEQPEQHPLIRSEQLLYDKVRRHLSQLLIERSRQVDHDGDLIALRDQIAEARLEDVAPLVEHMYRTAALAAQRSGTVAPPPDPASPYFGHMSLAEGGHTREVLLGRRSHIDREAGVVIVDWRNAPISRIFYRYDEGDSYEERIGGRVTEGEIRARRTVSIQAGALRRITHPQGSLVRRLDGGWLSYEGNESRLAGGQRSALRASVSADKKRRRGQARRHLGIDQQGLVRPDKHLPEIAALLDRHQFDLITAPGQGLLVLSGGAGSGKTTVALHRLAYLHYQDPHRFRPRHMLIVVPARGLVEYVGSVLPGLEVDKVRVSTCLSWARHTRRRMLPELPFRSVDDLDERAAQVKKHPLMLGRIDALVQRQQQQLRAQIAEHMQQQPEVREILAAFDRGEATALAQRIAAARSQALRMGGRVRDAVLKDLSLARRRCDDVLADWAELCTDREGLHAAFAEHAGAPDAETIEHAIRFTLSQCEDPTRLEDSIDPERRRGVDGAEEASGPASTLQACDEPLLLRLWQVKHGGLTSSGGKPITYDHIAVDEAQDLSAIELRVLLDAARDQSVTLAGDMAQKVIFDNSLDSWQGLLEAIGQAPDAVQTLQLAYRSTAEIMSLAHRVLGPLAPPRSPACTREGVAPELFCFADPGEVAAFLGEALRSLMLRERVANVAVLSRFAAQADEIHAGLQHAEVPRLRRVRGGDFSFKPGIDVTDIASAKGLEYDYVVLVDVDRASYPDTLECRHLLHVGLTRAVHQLWITCASEPSPLLPAELRQELASLRVEAAGP